MKRRILFFISVILFSFILILVSNAQETAFVEKLFDGKALCEYTNPDSLTEVKGQSAYLYNLETGTVVYRKNDDVTVYPASTVKLMTAIVAYENIPDLNTVITASKSAVLATHGSNMAIKEGEKFTAEQLLYGLLVTGANDAANVLAEYVGGNISGFCELMNEKAKELGAENTHYTNPTGLHSAEMITTAKDTAIIAKHFYSINELFEMSDTTRYSIDKNEHILVDRILLNRNLLISRVRSEKYYYSRAMGMSLGSTPEAGECVVTAALDDNGLTYICVVMNAPSDEKESFACLDAVNLLKMCLKQFTYSVVLSSKNIVCEVPVKLAVDTDYVTLLPGEELMARLPANMNYSEDITIEPRVTSEYATAPIYEGDKLGEAVVKYKDEIILGSVSLVAAKAVDKSNVLYFLDKAQHIILGHWFRVFAVFAIILLVLYFAASVFFQSRRYKRHNRRR